MARNGGDVHGGTASVLASSSSSSRRSENLQRLIDSADQSVNLLASLDSWAPDAITGSAAPSQSSSAAFNPFASGSSSYHFGASSSNSQPRADTDANAYGDTTDDDLNVVDLSVQRGMLHVKGVFPDHSVEYADIDPRFTTIGDLKRVLCEKRNSKKDLGFAAGDARVMFNGQLVENDWLVVDCGLGVDGMIYVVKAMPTGAYFGGGGSSGARAGDARLPVASIASSYAQQQQQQTQHRTRQQKEADEDSMLVEFNETLALDTTQSGQLSHKVRPEESNFAEMLSDFYQNLDNVHDTDGYSERLLRGYIDVLQSRLEHLEASVEGSSRFAAHQRQRLHDSIKELRDERNTWRLLYELRRICHAKENGADEMLMDMSEEPEDVRFDMVEGDAVRLLETHNENYKIQKAVKTWLENIAMENTVAVNDKRSVAKHGTRTLKMAKKGFIPRSHVHLDPDAVLRTGDRHVVDDDAEDEAELLKGVWSFVRAGNLEQAVDLCVRVGEPWRAASLSGGIQVGAASDMDDDDRSLERWGNPMRALWKTTCWKFAETKNLKLSKRNSVQSSQYEEIIYAALSGHVQVLTQSTLSESWEDHCWAYLHAMTEQQIDDTLHKLLNVKLQSSQLVVGNDAHYLRLYRALLDKTKYLKRYQVNLDALFDDLRNSKSDVVRKQAQEPYRLIQAKLVTAKIESIVTSVANGLAADDSETFDWKLRTDEHVPADDVTPFFLRFAAHFVLFASFTDEKMDEMANHMVVKAYIRHLVKHGHFKLVPIYASRLPVDGSIEVYVQVLGSLDDRLERELFLRRIHEFASIDVLTAVVTTTVERLSAEYLRQVRQSAASAQDVTTRVDRKRMRLIEFLCFYNDHRAEALRRANLLAREFVIEGKFSAVKELLIEHVPEDSIGLVNLHRGVQSVDGDDEIERILRAHLCWKAYIRACHHYDLWRSCSAGRSDTFWKAYSEEKEFLTELTYHVSRSTVAIVDVLQFEDGWMLHCSDDVELDASVRRACLPLLAIHLHFIQLESAKLVLRLQFYPTPAKVQLVQPLLEKSLQVADVVADEHYAVSDVLTPAHCQELLNGFRESAIALLHLESMAPLDDNADDDEEAPQQTIQPTEL